MKGILAVKNKSGIFLSRDEQMEEFLDKGFSLYIYKNGEKELIATPEEGFLGEMPTIFGNNKGDI